MRNRYLDLLRAVAIVRVVVYHHFGWAWLSIAFPAMGVMFAVAGSLTAASLAKRSGATVVGSRMRRLLPPVWLLGLLAVPVMLYTGWASQTDGEHPFQPATLVFWLLPLGDPPGSDSAAFVWDALWYVRTYLWLVVLSPLLFPLFRRIGWPLLGLPLLLMLALGRGDWGLPGPVESALWDLATYGACWLAGFAHRDGRLARLHPAVAVAAFAGLAGLGLHWLIQGAAETGWDLNEVSEAQAVYSLAFVLVALRWQPPVGRILRHPRVDRLVSLLNARAVTVYLWHGAAIASVWPILGFLAMDDLGDFEAPVTLGVTFAVTGLAIVAFGWAEDLAAKRRPRLWPADRGPRSAPTVATEPVGPVPAGWPEVDRFGEPLTEPPPRGGAPARHAEDLAAADNAVDLPVAGRPIPGYAPLASRLLADGGAPHATGAPAEHAGGHRREDWRAGPQLGASDPDAPAPIRYHGGGTDAP